jgi:hypothetical protein
MQTPYEKTQHTWWRLMYQMGTGPGTLCLQQICEDCGALGPDRILLDHGDELDILLPGGNRHRGQVTCEYHLYGPGTVATSTGYNVFKIELETSDGTALMLDPHRPPKKAMILGRIVNGGKNFFSNDQLTQGIKSGLGTFWRPKYESWG